MPQTDDLLDLRTETEAIEQIARKHEQMWNAHDRVGYESLFTEDADFVNVLGHHSHSRQTLGADFEQIHRTFMRNTVLKIEKPQVRLLDGTHAIAHLRWSMTGMEKVPGWDTPDVRHGIVLYVLVKRDGQWQVTALQNTEEMPLPLPK